MQTLMQTLLFQDRSLQAQVSNNINNKHFRYAGAHTLCLPPCALRNTPSKLYILLQPYIKLSDRLRLTLTSIQTRPCLLPAYAEEDRIHRSPRFAILDYKMAPDQVDTTRTDAKVDETMNSTGMDEKPKDKPKEKKFKRKTSLWQGAPVAPVFTPDPNTTIEEQAQKENDFIGSGDYFNLKLDWVSTSYSASVNGKSHAKPP